MDSVRKRKNNIVDLRSKPQIPTKSSGFESMPVTHNIETRTTQKTLNRVIQKKRKENRFRNFGRILLIMFLALVICLAAYFGFLLWKTYAVSKKISITPQDSSFSENIRNAISTILPSSDNNISLRGYEEGRINILLLGAAGEKKPGKNLTDTVMIMSIDTKNRRVSLLSLPRDMYVRIGDSQTYTKLNSVYQIGLSDNNGAEYIKHTVREITGLDIHYYAVVNFDAFIQVIDKIGGIKVTVERDIYDARYPGPNYSYETFELKKGLQNMDGSTALKYVRERHDDPEGDFGRAKRQQQVIQAVKNKAFSAQTILNPIAISGILDSVGENIKTDLTLEELEQCLMLSRMVDMQNITNAVVDAWKPESLLKVSHVFVSGVNAFILVPRVGNYSEIQELAQNIFNQDVLRKRHENISAENASVAIINRSNDHALPQKIRSLLIDRLGIENVRIETENDSEEQSDSLIQDNTSGQKLFTLDELTKKLPAKFATDNQVDIDKDSDYDFIIILGKDLVDIYKYEERSIEEFNKAQDDQVLREK